MLAKNRFSDCWVLCLSFSLSIFAAVCRCWWWWRWHNRLIRSWRRSIECGLKAWVDDAICPMHSRHSPRIAREEGKMINMRLIGQQGVVLSLPRLKSVSYTAAFADNDVRRILWCVFFLVVIVDLLSIWYIIPWPAMQIAMNEWMEGFNHFQLWSSSALTILRYLMGLTGDYVWLETNPIHYWLIKFVVFALWRGSYFHSNWISLLWLNFRRCGAPKTFQWRMKYFDRSLQFMRYFACEHILWKRFEHCHWQSGTFCLIWINGWAEKHYSQVIHQCRNHYFGMVDDLIW